MNRRPAEVLAAIERECLAFDDAMTALDWARCDASWQEQRRLTHELEIVMRDLPAQSDEAVQARRRIERLMRYRDGQIAKLRTFNKNVAKKLATMGKFRSFARARGAADRPSSFLDLDR